MRAAISPPRFRQPRRTAGQPAGSDAPPDEPQRPPEDGDHSVDVRVGSPAFLPPADFRPFAGGAWRASWSPRKARAYTRWLATNHYENFHVVSFLLPKRLHQDFYNVYAYLPLGGRSRRRDRRHGREPAPARLVARRTGCHVRGARHASRCSWRLAATVDAVRHPAAAVRRPDRRLRAGPDGHALSQLGRSSSATAAIRPIRWGGWCSISCGYSRCRAPALSDATCTALQLANFWQDVTVDLLEGPRLHSARGHGAARLHAWRICSRGASLRRFAP